MRFRENIRVDAEGDPGPNATHASPLGQQGGLGFTLHIENQNAGSQGEIDLRSCLAHTRKDHPASGLLIHLEDALKFSPGDDIESRTASRQQLEDREIGIRLYGIANEVIAMSKGIREKLITVEYLPR